jgi:hypothetical protein
VVLFATYLYTKPDRVPAPSTLPFSDIDKVGQTEAVMQYADAGLHARSPSRANDEMPGTPAGDWGMRSKRDA